LIKINNHIISVQNICTDKMRMKFISGGQPMQARRFSPAVCPPGAAGGKNLFCRALDGKFR